MKLFKKLKTFFAPKEREVTYLFNVSSRNTNRYLLGNETVNIVLREVRVFNVKYPRLSSQDVLLSINNLVGIVKHATLDSGILYTINTISKQSEETLKLNSEVSKLLDFVFKDDHAKTFTLTVKGKGEKMKDLKTKSGLDVIKHVITNKLDCNFKEI